MTKVDEYLAAIVEVHPRDRPGQVAWGTAKRTYRITDRGLELDEARELQHDLRREDLKPRWPPGSDYWPFKQATDVVVLGNAYGPGGREVEHRLTTVRVDRVTKRVEVWGRREVEWTSDGKPRIGAPEAFREMSVVAANAYGGADTRVPVPPPKSFFEELRLVADHPGAYPRNPMGKGYLVIDERLDGIELPNLEDPAHPLTADNLIVGDPALWYRQPLPCMLDWQTQGMFPRLAYTGESPWWPLPADASLEEVRRGFVPEDWRALAGSLTGGKRVPPVFFQEASLGMIFANLADGTPIEIEGMHPERDKLSFALPAAPRLEIEIEGDRQPVETRVLHVVVTPHEERVEITYAGIRQEMPRAFIPGVHGEIPITLFVDGFAVPYQTPVPIRARLEAAEAERGGPFDPRAMQRRPGEAGYLEITGALLPEERPQRERDQVALVEAPRLGSVDPSAGRLLLVETDWELRGPVPFAFRRFYSSSSAWRAGELGLGWTHCLEQAIWEQAGWVIYRMEDGREIGVPLPGGELGLGRVVHHANAGVTIHRIASDSWGVRLDDGRRFAFTRLEETVSVGPPKARLSEIYGPDGAALSVRYDMNARLDRMMVPSGNYVRFEHDERGRMTRVFAPTRDGRDKTVAIAFTVDRTGQLREAMDAMGRTTTYRYQGGLLVECRLPSGDRRRFAYDSAGARARCVVERFGEDEREREVLWEPSDRVVGLIDGNGNSFSMRVDERFGVTRVLDVFANETTRVFDEASGLLVSQTTPDGETTFLYDAAYHLAEVSAPAEGSVQLEHDADGRLTSRRDPDGHTEQAHWDHLGRLTATVDRRGASVVFEYDGEGPLKSVQMPGDLRLFLERDVTGKAVVGLRSPLGERRAERDALGRVERVTDERGQQEHFRYDPCGRVREHLRPADVRMTYESDACGRVTSVHDGARALELERDEQGRLSHVDEGGGEGIRLHRDAEGRVTMVESEEHDYWELRRDAAGRVIEESGFTGEERHVLRDHAGRIVRTLRGRARTTVERDGAGRPVAIEHSDETFERFAWTPGSRLARAQHQDRVVTFERDGEGRIAKESSGGREVSSRYDALGRRVAVDTSLGFSLRVERDALGHAMKLVGTLGERRLPIVFERNANGDEVKRLLPGDLELRFERDGLGRTTRMEIYQADRELAHREHAYAGLGRLVRVHDGQGRPRNHVHDARGRLVKAGGLVRALDSFGRVFRSPERDDHRYEGAHLVESYGNRYERDGAGRRIARIDALGDAIRYSWDGLGRLVTVHLGDADRISYDYDGLGRLVWRRRESRIELPGLDEPVWEPTSETELVWDGLAILHEIEGARVTTWIREGGRLVGKLCTDGAWAVLTDPNGVVTELTDAAGDFAWRGSIDMFGTVALDIAQTGCPWRLPGHWEDPDTGLQHAWLRVYDPETGAYLTPNPLGIVAGSNLYEYLPDPLSETSPLGLARGYATLGGEVLSERLEAELVSCFITALDRDDGVAGPRERFDPAAARWRLPDPEATLWGPWESYRPARRMPARSARYTRLPRHLGLSADESQG